jgi:hypothetical protein
MSDRIMTTPMPVPPLEYRNLVGRPEEKYYDGSEAHRSVRRALPDHSFRSVLRLRLRPPKIQGFGGFTSRRNAAPPGPGRLAPKGIARPTLG